MKTIISLFLSASIVFAQIIGGGGGAGMGTTTRSYIYEYAGICQGGVAGFALNIPASNAPSPANCANATAVLAFPTAQSTYSAYATILLPLGYATGDTISWIIESRSSDSTHAAVVTPAWAFAATPGAIDAPSYTGLTPVNITGAATSGRVITSGTFTTSTAAASNRLWFRITVDTNTNSLTGTFDLISLKLALVAAI